MDTKNGGSEMFRVINNKAEFIGQVEKNSSEAIRLYIYEWRGSHYLDIRIFYKTKSEPANELLTKKGFRFRFEILNDLINLLKRA